MQAKGVRFLPVANWPEFLGDTFFFPSKSSQCKNYIHSVQPNTDIQAKLMLPGEYKFHINTNNKVYLGFERYKVFSQM